MNILFRQRDSKQCRFQMPNDVWKWELKPQGFAILAISAISILITEILLYQARIRLQPNCT